MSEELLEFYEVIFTVNGDQPTKEELKSLQKKVKEYLSDQCLDVRVIVAKKMSREP